MIGSIDSQVDIEVYLEREELERLSDESIEGTLIRLQAPKRQGTVSIFIDELRKNEKGFGIGLDDTSYWGVEENFCIKIFIGSKEYNSLREKGVISRRQRMMDGSKITIYDKSKLERRDEIALEDLEYYSDNKEELPENLG